MNDEIGPPLIGLITALALLCGAIWFGTYLSEKEKFERRACEERFCSHVLQKNPSDYVNFSTCSLHLCKQ